MASTRNINTPLNYCAEQRTYRQAEGYCMYKHSQYGTAVSTNMPGTGLNPGQIPWTSLSYNPVEIESFLFGINSTNLVNPAAPLNPQIKELGTTNLFARGPTLIPEPLIIVKSQRPFPSP